MAKGLIREGMETEVTRREKIQVWHDNTTGRLKSKKKKTTTTKHTHKNKTTGRKKDHKTTDEPKFISFQNFLL